MSIEIERKFLVKNNNYKKESYAKKYIKQGFLNSDKNRVVRIRIADDKAFTVVEGWRIREIDAALAREGWIEAGEYKKLANDPSQFTAPFELPTRSLEGYLYPETYMLSPSQFTVKQFIQRQIDLLNKNFYEPNKAEIEASKRSFNEIVIMASLLEREEPKDENRGLVSGIIWKRLDNDWNLGIDATSHYSLVDWNDRKGLLRNLRDRNDPYNTRLRQGHDAGAMFERCLFGGPERMFGRQGQRGKGLERPVG